MNLSEVIRYVLWFLLYMALQILVLRNLVLFDYGFCFIYVAGILLVPAHYNSTLLIILSFITGIILDFFYNTFGLHAAATVLVAYLRPFWIHLHLEFKDSERDEISLPNLRLGRFVTFLLPLIFIHHLVLFMVELSHLGLIWQALGRIIASSFLTLVAILLSQLFVRR